MNENEIRKRLMAIQVWVNRQGACLSEEQRRHLAAGLVVLAKEIEPAVCGPAGPLSETSAEFFGNES